MTMRHLSLPMVLYLTNVFLKQRTLDSQVIKDMVLSSCTKNLLNGRFILKNSPQIIQSSGIS